MMIKSTRDTGLDNPFDLDAEITTAAATAAPQITSKFICTPGCTSPGGGSFCSWCC
jgi:gallidermin/nisin family lantibiotic